VARRRTVTPRICETFGMVFVADALAGWLIGQLTDAGRKRLGMWLLGSEQERALQQAATAAIQATAEQLRPWPPSPDDTQSVDHLARVIDQVFQKAPTPAESLADHATLLQGLHAGVAERLDVLADANVTGTDQSSSELLGVSVPAVADLLTAQLMREIVARGASGGPLTPLASQLNDDVTHLQVHQANATLGQLIIDQRFMRSILDRLDQKTPSIPARTTQPLGRPIHERNCSGLRPAAAGLTVGGLLV
jgi:hypothetical protein